MKNISTQRGQSTIVIALVVALLAAAAAYGYKSMYSYRDAAPTETGVTTGSTSSGTATSTVDSPLLGTQWSWKYSDTPEGSVTAPAGDRFVITFNEDRSVTSSTDCNRMTGRFTVNGEILSFGPFAMTKMYCAGSLEAEYARQLGLTASHIIQGPELRLILLKDAGTMVFTRNFKAE